MSTQELIELYEKGESIAGLSRLSGLTTYMVKKILVDNKVKVRTRAEQNVITNMSRKRPVDETYFSNIDTYNKGWVLGFLMADGTVRDDRNEIKIGLSSVDKEILEKIKKELKISQNIYDTTTQNGFNVSELRWSSQQQKKDLAKYGIVNRKTYLESHLPLFEDKKITLAFILGFFDGDGSFSANGKYCRFRLCAHRPELLQDIATFLSNEYNSSYSLSQDNRGVWELSFSTNTAKQILTEAYNLNSIRLDRKYQKYLEYINHETMTSDKDEKLC